MLPQLESMQNYVVKNTKFHPLTFKFEGVEKIIELAGPGRKMSNFQRQRLQSTLKK